MMIEEGTIDDFKQCVLAYMSSTCEYEIETMLLAEAEREGVFGSSLGYEIKNEWLNITFLFFTAANSQAIVSDRFYRIARAGDCYVDDYEIVPYNRIQYKGWVRYRHVLSVNVISLMDGTRKGIVSGIAARKLLESAKPPAILTHDRRIGHII